MKQRLVHVLWGDLSTLEIKKFAVLGAGMFCIIGSFWPIKILKDSVFGNLIGPLLSPVAKIFSLGIFFLLVLLYTHVVEYISRERMLYLLVCLFSVTGFVFAFFLAHPTIGVSNQTVGISRMLGWLFYFFVESYAGFLVALYWSFINDITTPDDAQKGYGIIVFGSQLGGVSTMVASTYLISNPSYYPSVVPWIVFSSMILLLCAGIVIFLFHTYIPQTELEGYQGKEARDTNQFSISFFEGLRLLFVNPYVTGIFSLIFFHESLATIIQFHMYILAKMTYADPALYTKYLFNFGLIVQLLACTVSLLGTSFLQRVLGVKFCLVAYPTLLLLGLVGHFFYPTLFFITLAMICIKAMSYAVYGPAKEMLYIPTSKDIRYRSKAWIDVFGARLSKGVGAFIFRFGGASLSLLGNLIFVVIMLWIFVAQKMGYQFDSLIKKKEIIK